MVGESKLKKIKGGVGRKRESGKGREPVSRRRIGFQTIAERIKKRKGQLAEAKV